MLSMHPMHNHPIQKCTYRGDLKCHYCKAEGHIAQLHQVENVEFRMKLLTEYGISSFGHFIRNSNKGQQRRQQATPSRSHQNPWAEAGNSGRTHPVKRLGWMKRSN